MTLLSVHGLRGGYSEVDILAGIDISLEPGEIVTVAGTNGAGKSTLIKAIMGLLPRVHGEVRVEGRDLLACDSEDRLGLGVSYVPQVANVFATLTVKENLEVVEHVSARKHRMEEMFTLFPRLGERRRVRASALSGGERQQLAIARALMPRPRVVLLDEPTAALSPGLASQVFALIANLPAHGAAALVVEQRARECLAVSDRGYVLDHGRVVLTGTAADLLADGRMADLYLGRAA